VCGSLTGSLPGINGESFPYCAGVSLCDAFDRDPRPGSSPDGSPPPSWLQVNFGFLTVRHSDGSYGKRVVVLARLVPSWWSSPFFMNFCFSCAAEPLFLFCFFSGRTLLPHFFDRRLPLGLFFTKFFFGFFVADQRQPRPPDRASRLPNDCSPAGYFIVY